MVAVGVVLVAVLGGAAVFAAGGAAKRRDRADIVAYEAATAPAMDALDRALAALVALEPRLETSSGADRRSIAERHRIPLEAARTALINLRVPDILRHITADQLNALNRTIGVITQLDRIVAGDDPAGSAGRQYRSILMAAISHQAAAVASLHDLRCLAGLVCARV